LQSEAAAEAVVPPNPVAIYNTAIKGSGLDNTLILLIVFAVFFYKLRK